LAAVGKVANNQNEVMHMDPVKDQDDAGATEFELLDLGVATEQTKGQESGITLDGGDPPFHRLLCFPC
jgi:hypothetical protein